MNKPRHVFLLLIACCIAVYWPICGYEFIIWDDGLNVYTNPYMNPPSLENVLFFWENAFQGFYIPLTYSFWSLIAWLSGVLNLNSPSGFLNPGIFHTASLVIHIITTIVLYNLLCFILPYIQEKGRVGEADIPDRIPPLCGALFFALHPIQVEAVAWITDMKDLLCALFFITGVWFFLLSAQPLEDSGRSEKQKRFLYWCSFFAFLLAMLSKPIAVTFPLIALLLSQALFGGALLLRLRSLVPWIVAAIPFVIITKLQQPDQSIGYITPFYLRPFVAGDALSFYMGQLFIPINLGMDYNRPPEYVLQQWWGYTTWLIPLSLFLIIFFVRSRTLLLSFGVLVCALLPVLGFLPFLFQQFSTVTDHYLYIPMFGAAIAFAWGITKIPAGKSIVIGGGTLLLLAFLAHQQVRHWENTFTIMSHTSQVTPRSYVAHTNLGKYYFEQEAYEDAAQEYIEAIRINPADPKHRNNLAAAYAKMGNFQNAIRNYLKSISLDPNFSVAHKNLAEILEEQRKRRFRDSTSNEKKLLIKL